MVNKLDKNRDRELIFPDYYEVDGNGNILYTIRRYDFENVKYNGVSINSKNIIILNSNPKGIWVLLRDDVNHSFFC